MLTPGDLGTSPSSVDVGKPSNLRDTIDQGSVPTAQFTPQELAAIRSGAPNIPGWTWHHHQDTGHKQLVSRVIHSQVDHIGSVSLRKK